MPSLHSRATVLVALAVCTSCGPQPAARTLGPPVTVEPRSLSEPGPAEPPSSETKRSNAPGACDTASSFVEIKDGDITRRFAFGRKTHERGAHYAYAEIIVHGKDSNVLRIGAVGGEKPGQGLLEISVEPEEMQPGEMYPAMIEYSRPGWTGHRNEEFELHEEKITVTRIGAVGEVVEGFVDPIALKDDTGDEATLTIRFHVCRVADYHIRVR